MQEPASAEGERTEGEAAQEREATSGVAAAAESSNEGAHDLTLPRATDLSTPTVGLLSEHAEGSSSSGPKIPKLRTKSVNASRMSRASSTMSPRMLMKNASSALVHIQEGAKEVMHAIRPGVDLALGIDVLGLPPPPPGGAPPGAPPPPPPMERMESSRFEEEELFEVEVEGEHAESLIAGEGLTSAVLRDGSDDDGKPLLDWAEELLLLSHEPMRRDMLEMQRALQVGYFGDLPESWRVKAFFRFFHCWCLLVSQQHAVEVAVHYDWLVAPTGESESDSRREVLAYHRKVELEMHSISRLENKVLEELVSMDTHEPWSESAHQLRERVGALCTEIRAHLTAQERLLPRLLRDHWGRISPPQLVTRSLKAAKAALATGAKSKSSDRPLFLMWLLHYLRRRDPQRARYFQAQLPFMTRLQIAMRHQKHTQFLSYLRYIVRDEQPAASVIGGGTASVRSVRSEAPSDPNGPRRPDDRMGNQHESERRAGMVSAMLAAANAERVDMPTSGSGPTRSLAESQNPAHNYNDKTDWALKHSKVPSNIFKKIGIEQPSTPRRL